jgi:hypothetical protein
MVSDVPFAQGIKKLLDDDRVKGFSIGSHMDLSVYIQALKKLNFDGQLSFDYYNDRYRDVAKKCIKYFYQLV